MCCPFTEIIERASNNKYKSHWNLCIICLFTSMEVNNEPQTDVWRASEWTWWLTFFFSAAAFLFFRSLAKYVWGYAMVCECLCEQRWWNQRTLTYTTHTHMHTCMWNEPFVCQKQKKNRHHDCAHASAVAWSWPCRLCRSVDVCTLPLVSKFTITNVS